MELKFVRHKSNFEKRIISGQISSYWISVAALLHHYHRQYSMLLYYQNNIVCFTVGRHTPLYATLPVTAEVGGYADIAAAVAIRREIENADVALWLPKIKTSIIRFRRYISVDFY